MCCFVLKKTKEDSNKDMPTYDYHCKACQKSFEIKHSIHDDALTTCPKCSKNTLKRGLGGGVYASVSDEPNTLQQLADRNTKEMGRYELQERLRANEEGDIIKQRRKKLGMDGYKPWYKDDKYGGDKTKEIKTMTKKQREKFIVEGKT